MESQRHLVLVVDADAGFAEDARMLLSEQRVVTARTIDEASQIVPGGRIDVALLGPSFGSEGGIEASQALRAADPTLPLVLVANLITNRMMAAGMKIGFTGVFETPLTLRKIDEILASARGGGAVHPNHEAARPVAPIDAPHVVSVEFVSEEHEAVSGTAVRAAFTTMSGPRTAQPPRTAVTPPAPADERLFAPDPDWQSASPLRNGAREVLDPPLVREAPKQVVEQTSPSPIVETPPPAPAIARAEPVVALPPVARVEPLPRPESADIFPYPPQPSSPPPRREIEDLLVIHPETRPPLRAGVVIPSPLSQTGPPPLRRTSSRGGRVVAVMAGKGGSGKTVTATNLAMALTFQRGPDRVVIVDTDLQFGDVALLLQLDPSRTILDVVRRVDDLSDELLESMLLRHESGLRVLPAPVLPTGEDEVPAKTIVAILERLRALHDVVIIDTPPIFDDHLITVLEEADDVLVVVDMDLPSVKNAKIALDALRGSGFPMGRLQLVVNRVNAKARLDLVELERSLGLRVAGSIPSDRLVPQSVNEGIPVVALSPRSRVARAFHVLAGLIRLDDSHG
ncbi:MAG: AAA family ATPase [Actinomycetota bacterium]|mgnify:CR=1 FL=1